MATDCVGYYFSFFFLSMQFFTFFHIHILIDIVILLITTTSYNIHIPFSLSAFLLIPVVRCVLSGLPLLPSNRSKGSRVRSSLALGSYPVALTVHCECTSSRTARG